MQSTDGLARGVVALDTGSSISVPVGQETLGRLWNVLGQAIDEREAPPADMERWPIHRDPPSFRDLSPKQEIFETASRSSIYSRPTSKAGKIGFFGGAGVGKTVLIES